jgi:hypothetical protein
MPGRRCSCCRELRQLRRVEVEVQSGRGSRHLLMSLLCGGCAGALLDTGNFVPTYHQLRLRRDSVAAAAVGAR